MTGIVVTGPPRSGTSAVTRLLDLSGLHVCIPGDRLGGGPNNPTGHWESRSVLEVNKRILDEVGMRWWCPPTPGYPLACAPGDAGRARLAFRAAHPISPWVCKDPRFSFTLSWWRDILDDVAASVVVLRRPDEVVASMLRTWRLSIEHAAALWVRYLHAALRSARELPVVLVRFPEILDDVLAGLVPVGDELSRLGIPPARSGVRERLSFLRIPAGSRAHQPIPEFAWQLWDQLTSVPSDQRAVTQLVEHPAVEGVLGPLREELRAGRPIDTRPVFADAGEVVG